MSTIAPHSTVSSAAPARRPRPKSTEDTFYTVAASTVVALAVGLVTWAFTSQSGSPATAAGLSSGGSALISTADSVEQERQAFEQRQQALAQEHQRQAKILEQQRIAGEQEIARQTKLLEQQRIAAEQEAARQARRLEEQRIAAEKQARNRMILARIEGLESEISVLRRDMTATENQRADHQTRVTEYMMDHKMAIAALAAGAAGAGVAMDNNNEFSDDAKAIGGVTATIAVLWAIANHEEVLEVADCMAKASAVQTDYKNRISRMSQRVTTLHSQIAQEKRNLEQ
ncbi:hypothetical protein [Prosthecobacter sp.]|uniref:hypothetical protein n=1 Tax=Prosthecobacter sp. TaxID=1965333 RepID=UPI0037835F15